MKKYCVKCGKLFEATGREVICPACKQAAAEETKRAAVLRAKRASWTGESVPVRISGRASTIIRAYGADNNLPFAAALDALLKASDYFGRMGKAWEDITPYKSHRRDKHTTEDEQGVKAALDVLLKQAAQEEVKQTAQDVPQEEVKTVKQEGKRMVVPFGEFGVVVNSETEASASKASKAKTASKAKIASKASKASASKANK